eukprot:CAMPEP_0185708486 /NCGR_PEP_ID=MMETSP1164-20130828/26672_1 /TAXON_ID=1104430 /ORGANISM="Chrysoreinhardia sp, Strain CCMP2950" /LENGTH=193 /DNA_ID=CAMNT_0028375945 /DNA_START=440 /DNA_END=1022 /DNA_ORIENTATION=+
MAPRKGRGQCSRWKGSQAISNGSHQTDMLASLGGAPPQEDRRGRGDASTALEGTDRGRCALPSLEPARAASSLCAALVRDPGRPTRAGRSTTEAAARHEPSVALGGAPNGGRRANRFLLSVCRAAAPSLSSTHESVAHARRPFVTTTTTTWDRQRAIEAAVDLEGRSTSRRRARRNKRTCGKRRAAVTTVVAE